MTAEGVDRLPIQIMAINKLNTSNIRNSQNMKSKMISISKKNNRSNNTNSKIKITTDKTTLGDKISHMTCSRVA
jgi:hypothetical protein